MPKCAATTIAGTPCKITVDRKGDLCQSHDPKFKKLRESRASKGGRGGGSMNIATVPDTKARLAEFHAAIILALANGRINHNMANALSSAVTKQWKMLTELGEKFASEIEALDEQGLIDKFKEIMKDE